MKLERMWFLAGYATLATAALTHAFGMRGNASAWMGLILIAGALTHGFIAPFLKREPRTLILAHLAFGAFLLTIVLGLLVTILFGLKIPSALYIVIAISTLLHYAFLGDPAGIAILLLVTHVLLTAIAGRPWRGGIALFATDQPFRRGDMLSATAFATSFAWLAFAGLTHILGIRGDEMTREIAITLGAIPAFFYGILLFFLPRNAKTPLPGITLHTAALLFHTLGTFGITLAFLRPLDAQPLYAAVATALGIGLALTAFLRLTFPEKPGPQITRALPILRGTYAVAILLALILPLAFYAFGLNTNIGLILLTLTVATTLSILAALASTILGAPILLNSTPRDGKWAHWATALAILALFLIAPSYQYARGAGPGHIAHALAIALTLWGLWPLRTPRREC